MIITDAQADFLNGFNHAIRKFIDSAEQVALRASADAAKVKELTPMGSFGPNHQTLMEYQVAFGKVQAYRDSMMSVFPLPEELENDEDGKTNFYRELDGLENLVRSNTIRVFIRNRNYEV